MKVHDADIQADAVFGIQGLNITLRCVHYLEVYLQLVYQMGFQCSFFFYLSAYGLILSGMYTVPNIVYKNETSFTEEMSDIRLTGYHMRHTPQL